MTSTDQWNPDQYRRFQGERSRPFFDLLSLIERDRVPLLGPRVVDLGCGPGELTAEAHRQLDAHTTVGVDSSSAMLERAAEHASSRLTFELGDIAEFPSAEAGSFDIVLANASLQWVPDHEAVLTRWAGALTDDGQLAVQVPANVDHPSHVIAAEVASSPEFEAAFAPAGGPPGDTVHNVLLPEQYAELLDEIGFAQQHVRLQVYGHHLESTSEVVEWAKGTSLTRFQRVLEPADYERFLEVYRARLLEALGDHSPFFYAFKRILMWARR
ncbi:MAG: methyltransferase domain-containing protein [Acidimicrobiia bacterium]